jgi:hypothetical protein
VVEVHNCIENIVVSQLEEIVISFLEASAHVCNDSVGQALRVGSLSIYAGLVNIILPESI